MRALGALGCGRGNAVHGSGGSAVGQDCRNRRLKLPVFLRETNGKPEVEKNFFAWAQGYMSGLLLRAPPGKDEDLDLAPDVYPLLKQAEFLRSFCTRNPDADFSDGVNDLYRTLRAPPS